MSLKPRRTLSHRFYVRAERVIAITAVALTAFGFAQPQVLALAGLDFAKPVSSLAGQIDRTPTGSVTRSDDAPPIHGLAGVLKPLRQKN